MTQSEETYLSVKETATRLSIHRNTVLRLINEGKLPGVFSLPVGQYGKKPWRIPLSSVEALIRDGQVAPEIKKGTSKRLRHGHAPGYLRETLCEWIDANWQEETLDEDARSINWLLGQLWHCTDVLPASYCDTLEILSGSTYAQAVRHIKKVLEEDS